MAYDDIPPLREAFSRLPLEVLNSSEASLLWVIISYPEGCFIGQELLAQTARLTLGTCKTNLRKLTNKNLITREQSYARKGVRQCYHANMAELKRLLERYDTSTDRVLLDTPKVSVQLKEPVSATKSPMGATKSPYGSNEINPYKEYKDYKYDKELFNEFLSNLRTDIVPFIEPGKNLEDLLLRVIQQDTSFKRLYGFLEKKNFSTSYKVGGLLITFLKEYLGVKKPGEKSGLPKWCGRSGCNETTRLWVEPSYDPLGRAYYECNLCNPEGIKKFKGQGDTRTDFEKSMSNLIQEMGEREGNEVAGFIFREVD